MFGFFFVFLQRFFPYMKFNYLKISKLKSVFYTLNNRKEKRTNQVNWIYRLFKAYLRFVHDRLYYRKTYCLHPEHIPADNTPLMIVSNHQNCLNDPLGILFAIRDRKPNFITRADVFSWNPFLAKFLRAIGLFPSFRINYEGGEALSKNQDTFQWTERELANGGTLVMFPEAGHQDKHWLGDFSYGYTKLAFEAAELDNFQKEIFILPSCNHYSDYFHIQSEFLVKFGTPISIQPYYELYKTKPRTAQRDVNALVRKQIEDLMLDIRDVDNYEAIDFLRNTYGMKYGEEHGYYMQILPERLLSDRSFVADLAKAKVANEAAVSDIYKDALLLKKSIREARISYENFDCVLSYPILASCALSLLILLPVWIFSLWPNALNFIAPKLILRRMNDKMFTGTFLYALSALFTIPIFYLLTFILAWVFCNWWIALIYLAMLPALGLFAWYYRKFAIDTWHAYRFRRYRKSEDIQTMVKLRRKIFKQMDGIMQNLSKNS